MQRDAWNIIGGSEAEREFVQYDMMRRCWETRLQLPWKRESADACVLRDRLVVFGGTRNDVPSACIDEYAFNSSAWTRNKSEKLRHRRSGIGVCGDGNNNAYIFGGDRKNPCLLVERYSIDDGSASAELASMGGERAYGSAVSDVGCCAAYVAGGGVYEKDSASYKTSESILCYDILNEKWKHVGNLSVPRAGLGAALLGDELYLAGGFNNSKLSADVVEIFNIRTGDKTRATPNMLEVRHGCSAVALDNNVLCVLGGVAMRKCKNSVEAFDKREGKWTMGSIVPDMPNNCAYFAVTVST